MNTDSKNTLQYQKHLLAQIFSLEHDDADVLDQGLKIYQNNLHMTAARSLSISYPVINKMVGEQAIYILAKRVLDIETPQSGDWSDWGQGLARILKQSELHEDHPYLSQMAELEWAFQIASRSPVEVLSTESLSLLTGENVEDLVFTLQSSLSLIVSDFPLGSLWRLHRNGDKYLMPDKNQLQHALNSDESGCYLIWQSASGAKLLAVNKDMFDWVHAVRSGKTLGALLDAFPEFDFSAWLSDSIVNQWLVSLNR